MKTIALVLFMLLIGVFSYGQPSEIFKTNMDKLYEEGFDKFLNTIFKNINYPQEARENCRVGVLKTLISIDTSGTIKSVSLVNSIGMGIDEEVIRVLNLTSSKWRKGKKLKYPISFAYRIGENQKDIEGDIIITALGIGASPDGGCSVPVEEIKKHIKKYIKKGNNSEALLLCEELLGKVKKIISQLG